jgi:integrase
MNRFVEMKEARSISCLRTKWILNEIDVFVIQYGLEKPVITLDLVRSWRKTRINDCEKTLYTKYSVWSQLAHYMCRCGQECFVTRLPKNPGKGDFVPYIFTVEQIAALMEKCDAIEAYDRHYNSLLLPLPAIIRLLYSTGLRISETLSIRNKDVKLKEGYIHIRKAKNGSERIVPVCASLSSVLESYETYRNRIPVKGITSPGSFYFVKLDGTGISPGSIYTRFRYLLAQCGIPHIGNHHGPRVHDLRHTFAVHALVQMAHGGMDLYAGLPILSACLGHKSLSATEQYVRLTCAAYPELESQCSEINAFIYPKIQLP